MQMSIVVSDQKLLMFLSPTNEKYRKSTVKNETNFWNLSV